MGVATALLRTTRLTVADVDSTAMRFRLVDFHDLSCEALRSGNDPVHRSHHGLRTFVLSRVWNTEGRGGARHAPGEIAANAVLVRADLLPGQAVRRRLIVWSIDD